MDAETVDGLITAVTPAIQPPERLFGRTEGELPAGSESPEQQAAGTLGLLPATTPAAGTQGQLPARREPPEQPAAGTRGQLPRRSELPLASQADVRKAQSLVRAVEGPSYSDALRDQAITAAIPLLYGPHVHPKDEQVYCIRQLVYHREDIILIAKTGFGKSMIMQAVSILTAKTITLSILPLNQIGKEQVENVKRYGGKALFLNADVKERARRLEEARAGVFSHIFLSPEFAVSDIFRPVITDSDFKKKLALVVIDEAHLVRQWGRKFRTTYAQLGVLRGILGSSAPWFACSATLDPESLSILKKSAGFHPHVDTRYTSINRPEIAIRLARIPKNSVANFSALRFLIDDAISPPIQYNNEYVDYKRRPLDCTATPFNIEKTIIFFNTKKEAEEARDAMVSYMQLLHPDYTDETAMSTTAVFHRHISAGMKQRILTEFRKPAKESRIRIVFATEAIGIGVDILDVRRVVIYRLPNPDPHLSTVVQRGGRAGRDGDIAELIILFEHWLWGDRKRPVAKVLSQLNPHLQLHTNPSSQSQFQRTRSQSVDSSTSDDNLLEGPLSQDQHQSSHSKKGAVGGKTEQTKRSELPDEFYNMVNSKDCIQTIILDFFKEPQKFRDLTNMQRCCSRCNTELRLDNIERRVYEERGPSFTQKRQYICKALEDWIGRSSLMVLNPKGRFPKDSNGVISYSTLRSIACNADQIRTLQDLNERIGYWEHAERFSDGLLNELHRAVEGYEAQSISQRVADTAGFGSQYNERIILDDCEKMSSQILPSGSEKSRPPLALTDGNARRRQRAI